MNIRTLFNTGQFYMGQSEKQFQAAVYGLPEEAGKGVSELWPIDDHPPLNEDTPIMQVIEEIAKRSASYWVSTSKKRTQKTVEWCREHAEEITAAWASDRIASKRRKIESLEREIAELSAMLPNEVATA